MPLSRSYLKFKAGVHVPTVCVMAAAAVNAANQVGLTTDITVTSGNDSQHMRGSKHYVDEALDFRTKTLSKADKTAWIAALKKRLGPNYDVILEAEGQNNEHLHVELDVA
jgi:hypothetical protein